MKKLFSILPVFLFLLFPFAIEKTSAQTLQINHGIKYFEPFHFLERSEVVQILWKKEYVKNIGIFHLYPNKFTYGETIFTEIDPNSVSFIGLKKQDYYFQDNNGFYKISFIGNSGRKFIFLIIDKSEIP